MEFTGERYVPSLKGQIYYYHVHRYAIAARFGAGKRVLDAASGEGYGAALMARTAAEVVGVDIDERSVEHARHSYYAANLRFLRGSVTELPLADASFDVVASFETIEYVGEQELFLDELRRVLRPGGVLVISSPNKLVYSDLPGITNPYHTKELYFSELRDLLTRRFRHVAIYGHRLAASSLVHPLAGGISAGAGWISGSPDRIDDGLPTFPAPVYFLAICSDEPPAFESCSAYVDAGDDLLEDIWTELNGMRAQRLTVLATPQPALAAEPLAVLADRGANAAFEHIDEPEAELAAVRAERDAVADAARADREAELAGLRAEHEAELAELRAGQERRGAAAQGEHDAQIRALRIAFDAQAAQVRADHERQTARLIQEVAQQAGAAEALRHDLDNIRLEMHRTREALLAAHGDLAAAHTRAKAVNEHLTELRIRFDAGERRAGELAAEGERERAESAALREHNGRLNDALEVAQRDSVALREVLSSNSWKLTDPLRRAFKLVRR